MTGLTEDLSGAQPLPTTKGDRSQVPGIVMGPHLNNVNAKLKKLRVFDNVTNTTRQMTVEEVEALGAS